MAKNTGAAHGCWWGGETPGVTTSGGLSAWSYCGGWMFFFCYQFDICFFTLPTCALWWVCAAMPGPKDLPKEDIAAIALLFNVGKCNKEIAKTTGLAL